MKSPICLALIHLLIFAAVQAQSPSASSGAGNPVQVSEPGNPSPEVREFKIPAGTPVEIETAYTVSSLDVHPEDLISFRVVVPIRVEGVTVLEKFALVSARVLEAKRGQHWGRAGKLTWVMQDAVAVDLTRVPLQFREEPDPKSTVKGTSHGGQVATQMIVFGALMWPIAPIMLMQGFKRGENAVLPEGKRFIVFVKQDTIVKIPVERRSNTSITRP